MIFQFNKMFQLKHEAYQMAGIDPVTGLVTVIRVPKVQLIVSGVQLVKTAEMPLSALTQLLQDAENYMEDNPTADSELVTRCRMFLRGFTVTSRTRDVPALSENFLNNGIEDAIHAVIAAPVDFWIYDQSFSLRKPVYKGEASSHLEAHILSRQALYQQCAQALN